MKGQGEAVMVVRGLPDSKRSSGRLEVREAVPAPELLRIDAVARLDFAVLLRASGPDVPMADPRGLDPSTKNENSCPWSHWSRVMGKGNAHWSSARKARLER